ncbi:hypothetical protein J2W32_004442 [Variovorax boronicumulans]|uniref:Uncharacterized protein n=1 Tax=Variovorax boronicumulans TaxID=436515 RepID=A0AAW8CY12_9BURK|nr:hypothetical protein [Variovorax boronicumulans]MDP9895344.1 hypothetical protein [Variovorax boronicumulans]MDQ0055384.1 hypothetical protein [Variovorax boronicumulans]
MASYRYLDPKPPAVAKIGERRVERLNSAWIRWLRAAQDGRDLHDAAQRASTLREPCDPPEPEVAVVIPHQSSPVLGGGATP